LKRLFGFETYLFIVQGKDVNKHERKYMI